MWWCNREVTSAASPSGDTKASQVENVSVHKGRLSDVADVITQ